MNTVTLSLDEIGAWVERAITSALDEAALRAKAYRYGWNQGHGVACHNVPRIGQKLFVEDFGRIEVTAENIREVHETLCFNAEMNSRDFSPWEFIAHELNSADDPAFGLSEELWEEYERGVGEAIWADLSTYSDQDYGILEAM